METKDFVLGFAAGKAHGGKSGRLYILDPDIMDSMYDSPHSSGLACIPYVGVTQNSSSGFSCPVSSSFGNLSNVCVVSRGGYQVGGMTIGRKIQAKTYQKMYVNIQVGADGTGWPVAQIVLTSVPKVASNGQIPNGIKSFWLVNRDMTDAEINSQEGIVINCVNKTLAAQIVEIDISDIEVDFYFGIWNCDRNVKIRSIYCE